MPIPKDKRKFALWLYPETLEKIKQLYAEDDCRNRQGSIDRKLRRKIEEKKQAQGLKQ